MIYSDYIERMRNDVDQAVNELYNAAFNNQKHPQDLLVAIEHGSYDDTLANSKDSGYLPYVVGPSFIGFAESTFYKYIDWYRHTHMISSDEHKSIKKNNPDRQEEERLLVQLELSIYLRFWESDYNLKRLYQLTRLANGQPYDWDKKIPINPRDGSKQEIIRLEIRDKIKEICPEYYALLREVYISQLRNAIAHSQFYILTDNISLLNFSKDEKAYASLPSINFETWYILFTKVLLLHNTLLKYSSQYKETYKIKTLKNENRIEIFLSGYAFNSASVMVVV